MPHKFYHGRTGRIYNVTKSAVGVVMNKQVGNRIIPKRINVRIEHIKHSKCRDDFLARVKKNHELRKQAKEKNEKVFLKRTPPGPRPAHYVSSRNNKPETIAPIPFEFLV